MAFVPRPPSNEIYNPNPVGIDISAATNASIAQKQADALPWQIFFGLLIVCIAVAIVVVIWQRRRGITNSADQAFVSSLAGAESARRKTASFFSSRWTRAKEKLDS